MKWLNQVRHHQQYNRRGCPGKCSHAVSSERSLQTPRNFPFEAQSFLLRPWSTLLSFSAAPTGSSLHANQDYLWRQESPTTQFQTQTIRLCPMTAFRSCSWCFFSSLVIVLNQSQISFLLRLRRGEGKSGTSTTKSFAHIQPSSPTCCSLFQTCHQLWSTRKSVTS